MISEDFVWSWFVTCDVVEKMIFLKKMTKIKKNIFLWNYRLYTLIFAPSFTSRQFTRRCSHTSAVMLGLLSLSRFLVKIEKTCLVKATIMILLLRSSLSRFKDYIDIMEFTEYKFKVIMKRRYADVSVRQFVFCLFDVSKNVKNHNLFNKMVIIT